MHRCLSYFSTLFLALSSCTPFSTLSTSLTFFLLCMTPHHCLPLHSHLFFLQPGKDKMRSTAFCPQINKPYSPLSPAVEVASSLYLAVQYGRGEVERERGSGTQGFLPACLMHYWGVRLSHQLQVEEGWNSLISCCTLKSGGKHSWPQLKSSVCEAEDDVSLCGNAQGFFWWGSAGELFW